MTIETKINQIYAIVAAAERRFPDHNGPFEYGTRLAEEVGELIEALYKTRGGINEESAAQLVKELLDVTRVTLGIARTYDVRTGIPEKVARAKDLLECVGWVGIASSVLAKAVNHMEGAGIKWQKHGNAPKERLLGGVDGMMSAIMAIVRFLNLEDRFNNEIAVTYNRYLTKGYI